jgi:hypothetical protein
VGYRSDLIRLCAALEEDKYGGLSTALRFGRDDRCCGKKLFSVAADPFGDAADCCAAGAFGLPGFVVVDPGCAGYI